MSQLVIHRALRAACLRAQAYRRGELAYHPASLRLQVADDFVWRVEQERDLELGRVDGVGSAGAALGTPQQVRRNGEDGPRVPNGPGAPLDEQGDGYA